MGSYPTLKNQLECKLGKSGIVCHSQYISALPVFPLRFIIINKNLLGRVILSKGSFAPLSTLDEVILILFRLMTVIRRINSSRTYTLFYREAQEVAMELKGCCVVYQDDDNSPSGKSVSRVLHFIKDQPHSLSILLLK